MDKFNQDEEFKEIVDELEEQALDYYCEALMEKFKEIEPLIKKRLKKKKIFKIFT